VTRDNRILSNFLVQAAGQFAGRFLFFLFFMMCARILGAREFGIFSLALSICYLCYTVMMFGLDHLSVKWVARKNNERFHAIAATHAVTTFAGFLLVLAAAAALERQAAWTLVTLGLGFCFFSINTLVFSYFRGIEQMKPEAVFLVGQRGGLLLIALALMAMYPVAPAAAVSFLISLSATSFFLMKMVSREGMVLYKPGGFRWKAVCSVLKEAAPLALVSGMGIIYYRIDSIMIAAFHQMTDVGIYGGAYMIVEGVMLLVRVIMAATFSRLSQYGSSPGQVFYRFYKKMLLLVTGLALVLAAVMFFAASPVFGLFLGTEYMAAVPVFHILLLSVVALYPGTLATQALIAVDRQMVYMVIALGCTLINVTLNLFLIPEYGIQGAAWATVISDFILTGACVGFLFRFFRKQEKVSCVSD
jgi:O-antigen/teichoic acid export membrane protein